MQNTESIFGKALKITFTFLQGYPGPTQILIPVFVALKVYIKFSETLMELSCGNLKRLMNYSSILLATRYPVLKPKSYSFVPWAVHL